MIPYDDERFTMRQQDTSLFISEWQEWNDSDGLFALWLAGDEDYTSLCLTVA